MLLHWIILKVWICKNCKFELWILYYYYYYNSYLWTVCFNRLPCSQPSSDPPSSQGIWGGVGGWRQRGRYVKLKLLNTACFIVVKSLNVLYHQSTHTLTSYPQPLHSRKIFAGNIFISFFNHALPKFKVRPVSPDFRFEADWLKCAALQTWVTLLASRYPFCYTIPAPFLLKPHTWNKGCWAEGPRQEFAEWAERTLTCRYGHL